MDRYMKSKHIMHTKRRGDTHFKDRDRIEQQQETFLPLRSHIKRKSNQRKKKVLSAEI
jgi:hypothetical protein